jgi:hypothetical protein
VKDISIATGIVVVGVAMYVAVVTSAVRQPTASTFPGVLDDHPAIQYRTRPTTDRIAQLSRDVSDGVTSLTFQQRGGYLPSLLATLGIPIESQLLVFSKTGVQRSQTGPRNPRAIFYDQSVVVGYIPGARFLEIAAHDPEQGTVFYTIDQASASKPDIARKTTCLSCHVSGSTLDVPGMITRSNQLSADGTPLPQLGFDIVDHRTPIALRWGGWFVTGNYINAPYGGVTHRGNVTTAMHPTSGPATTSNEVFIEWRNSEIESRGYLSHESDVAALMVFDHQVRAINLLTRVNWEFRAAAHEGRLEAGGDALRALVSELADYLLFVDEVPPPARIEPRPGFAERFVAAGPRDRQGRSLRQLDLDRRLLRYPCSYMIYTPAFDALPARAKAAIYRRLWMVLSGQDRDRKYAHLSASDRIAILEILRQTKTDFPADSR